MKPSRHRATPQPATACPWGPFPINSTPCARTYSQPCFIPVIISLSYLTNAALEASEEDLSQRVQDYFTPLFAGLESAAKQQRTVDNFREIMKPVISDIDGFFGSTLIDKDFVIRQVYRHRNFLSVGHDLKKIKGIYYFWDLMRKSPGPQLSEPGHGSLLQPRLIAMRYPVFKDGQLTGVFSLMIRTKAFLKSYRSRPTGCLSHPLSWPGSRN